MVDSNSTKVLQKGSEKGLALSIRILYKLFLGSNVIKVSAQNAKNCRNLYEFSKLDQKSKIDLKVCLHSNLFPDFICYRYSF